MKKKKVIPEDVKRLLKQVADHFDQEDRPARERQLRTWRRLKLVWEGFQRTWYSEVAHDWRIWDENITDSDNDQSYYDKPINVFRAYLESIIAALSITVPSIKCYPDDADNPLDLSTAKAGDKIADLIYRHNDAPLLWLHALFIFCTEGMTACYSYPKEDEEYGTYIKNDYEETTEESYVCPNCHANVPDEIMSNREMDEYMPDDDDIISHDLIGEEGPLCPECLALLDPALQKSPLIVTRLVGTTKMPKSRICTEVYGGLYVKVPNYAMKQRDIPYLHFNYETHYSNVVDRYEELEGKFGPGKPSSGSGPHDAYEQWARLSPQYHGEYPTGTVTVRNCWQRASSFHVLPSEDAKKLKKLYPDGVKIIIVNDCFADAEGECLDDCWTLTVNPLSDYIHHDPLGLLLTSIQDVTNDLVSLILQTIEHGIPQTFADPAVLNFEKYKQTEVIPGGIFPAKPQTGKTVGEAFHEVKTATLSQEVLPFFAKIQELGQIISGALPSLFGGQVSGSRTASEYSMSRAQALQRLQNNWKIFTMWWKAIYGKVIPMYIKEVQEDERNVELDDQGRFINVFIRKAEIEGKIGRIELEANENLPLTWSQKKDTYMQLLENQNPKVQETISSPENIQMLADAIGLADFTVPGADDRQKQYEEIQQLINSEPITIPPDPIAVEFAAMQGAPPPTEMEVPSVEIDPDVDNHDIEADICRRYLVSAAGRQLKLDNPMGYKNILLHMKAHMEQIQMSMMPPMDPNNPQQAAAPGSNSPLSQENANVPTAP